MKAFPLLLAACLLIGAGTVRPADAPPAVRGLRIEPSTAKVIVGRARLSVESLSRNGDGLSGHYKVEVSPVAVGNESGKLSVKVSDDDLRLLAEGQKVQFSGQAVNTSGGTSEVKGTAIPSGKGDGGKLNLHISGPKGVLIFSTSYHLEH